MVKSEKGYRVIVNDDSVTDDNADGWKSNDFEFNLGGKDQVLEKFKSILGELE